MQVFAALFSNPDGDQGNRPRVVFASSEEALFLKVLQCLKDNVEGFKEAMELDDAAIDLFTSIDDVNEFLCGIDYDDVIGETYIYTYEEAI